MSESDAIPPEESPAPQETLPSAEEQAALAAKKKQREMRLAAAIIVLWIVTGVSLYLEREHWFGSGKPAINAAVLDRSSD